MAQGLYSDSEGRVFLNEEQEPPLAQDQVRIHTELAAIKHGTEFHVFSKTSPFETEWFDAEMRLFVPKPEYDMLIPFSRGYLGNTVVGTIIEIGTTVTSLQSGDRVYGYAPAMDKVTMAEKDADLLGSLEATDALSLILSLISPFIVRWLDKFRENRVSEKNLILH